MPLIKFTKLHGQGNDYLYIDSQNLEASIDLKDLAIRMSDRHFGVGSDGIVILTESDLYDIDMRIFNADGSEAEMCGTALRATAFLMAEKLKKEKISINTRSGLKSALVDKNFVEVDMGMPVLISKDKVEITFSERTFSGYYVDMGNPHFVILESMKDMDELRKWGSLLEHNHFFSNKTNVEFISIINETMIDVDVWERGSGRTLACGTGACAAFFVANSLKLVGKEAQMQLPGGDVLVKLDNKRHLRLMGLVERVFDGLFYYGRING